MASTRGNALLGGGVKMHLPQGGGVKLHIPRRGSKINVTVPWKRKSRTEGQELARRTDQKSPSPSPSGSPTPSPQCMHSLHQQHLTPTPHRSLCTSKAEFKSLVTDFALWNEIEDQAVASLRTHIDDMFIQELTLGCDTELFNSILEAAGDVEAGGDHVIAASMARLAAKDSEEIALKSLRTRHDARDCVSGGGGLEDLEQRIRELRAQAVGEVMPLIEQMEADPEAAPTVRLGLQAKLEQAQEDYVTLNGMKTAKAEVILELQDESSQKDWMDRQLLSAAEFLESCQLPTELPREDVHHFFTSTLKERPADDPLRVRTINVLEGVFRWGNIAADILDTVGKDIADIKTDAPMLKKFDEQQDIATLTEFGFPKMEETLAHVNRSMAEIEGTNTSSPSNARVISRERRRTVDAERLEANGSKNVIKEIGSNVGAENTLSGQVCAEDPDGQGTPPSKRLSGHVSRSKDCPPPGGEVDGVSRGDREVSADTSVTPSQRTPGGRLSCPPHLASLEAFKTFATSPTDGYPVSRFGQISPRQTADAQAPLAA